MQTPTVGIYHDTRYRHADGGYPVKVSVTFKIGHRFVQKYYATGFNLSRADFEAISSTKVRKELRQISNAITSLKAKALGILKDSPFIKPDTFKALYTGTFVSASSVQHYFTLKINEHLARKTTQGEATAISYQCAWASINEHSPNGLLFVNIDIDWLKAYESWCIGKGYSTTTVAIYLRYLRAVFNKAIADKVVSAEDYPFGRNKYQIPKGNNIKKVLPAASLHKLLTHTPAEAWLARHLNFWKLSYYLVGINFKDIAYLKEENLQDGSLVYYRQKTISTRRQNKLIVVPLHPEAKKLIETLRVPDAAYLFNIITDDMTSKEKYYAITHWRNQCIRQVKEIANSLKISENIIGYTARHTSANNLLTNQVDLATLQDLLGHSTLASTQHYTQGLPHHQRKKLIIKSL